MGGADSIVATIAVVALVGYLIGSIPVANAVARRNAAGDLRTVGDRNPGYWNAKERLGRRAAVPVFIGDVVKGAAAAAVGLLLADDGQWWLPYIGTFAAMVGHAFPVFAGFRGGRSVLAFVGGVFVFTPVPALISVAVMVAVLVGTRRFDLAARVAVAVLPFVQIAIEGPYRTAATGVLMTFIGVRFAQAAISGRRTGRPSAGTSAPVGPSTGSTGSSGSTGTPGPATSDDA